MDRNIYVGDANNVAKSPTKIYVGDSSDKARLVQKIYVGDSNNKARQVWPPFIWSDIYQKCEYIYNTGRTEYIDTGIYPNNYTRFVMDFQIDDTQTQEKYIAIVQGNGSDSNNAFGVVSHIAECKLKLWYNTRWTGTSPATVATKTYANQTLLKDRHVIDFNQNGGNFYVDNELIGTSTKTFGTYAYSLPLFGFNNNYGFGTSNAQKFRLYSFKVYNNNDLVRDMVPCYRKADTEIGMYDFANDVFYTNDGTGIFYKGPDVD